MLCNYSRWLGNENLKLRLGEQNSTEHRWHCGLIIINSYTLINSFSRDIVNVTTSTNVFKLIIWTVLKQLLICRCHYWNCSRYSWPVQFPPRERERKYFHLFIRRGEGRELLWFISLLYDFCSILKLPLLSARTIFYMFSFVKHCNKTQLTLHGGIMKGSNNGNAQRTFTLPLHHSPAWPSARSGQFYQPFNGSD